MAASTAVALMTAASTSFSSAGLRGKVAPICAAAMLGSASCRQPGPPVLLYRLSRARFVSGTSYSPWTQAQLPPSTARLSRACFHSSLSLLTG